jgi:BASS family bile acid:Na+ symporter
MEPALAVGLVIVAICPGGPSSNLITYLAKGDVALSVTLTAISSVVTVFTIPVLANLALQLLMGSGSGSPQQR